MRHLIPLAAIMALTACGSNEDTTTVTTADGEEIKITSDTDKNNESGTITFEGKDGEGKITFGRQQRSQFHAQTALVDIAKLDQFQRRPRGELAVGLINNQERADVLGSIEKRPYRRLVLYETRRIVR